LDQRYQKCALELGFSSVFEKIDKTASWFPTIYFFDSQGKRIFSIVPNNDEKNNDSKKFKDFYAGLLRLNDTRQRMTIVFICSFKEYSMVEDGSDIKIFHDLYQEFIKDATPESDIPSSEDFYKHFKPENIKGEPVIIISYNNAAILLSQINELM